MKTYEFYVTINGTGSDIEEAWQDACEGFSLAGLIVPDNIGFLTLFRRTSIMNDRITQYDLECQVKRINQITKSPATPYTSNGDKMQANIGNYHLNYAYGGVKLSRMCNKGGEINDVSNIGYGTKRELYNWMNAILTGIAT